MPNNKIQDKWFYPPILILTFAFIYKFIVYSQVLKYFPLHDMLGDFGFHLSMLYFFVNYGLHGFALNWLGGFYPFLMYPPGWVSFTYPIYLTVKDFKLAAYISLILIYILAFIATYLIAKAENLSKVKKIAFSVFILMNPIVVDYALGIGRFGELYAWLIFLFLFLMIIYYKDRKLNKWFLLTAFFYFILLISHPYVYILGSLLLGLFLLCKSGFKNKIFILTCIITGVSLSSFWLFPFSKSLINYPTEIHYPTDYQYKEFLSREGTIISYNTVVIISFWFIFYLFWKSNKPIKKEDKIFYLPLLILSTFVIFRITPFLPFLKELPPNTYNIFFFIISLILFFKINFLKYPNIKKIIPLILIIFSLISFYVIIFHQPNPSLEYTNTEKEAIEIMKNIKGNFIIVKEKNDISDNKMLLYYYATVYYNLSTPLGSYWNVMPRRAKEIKDNLRYIISEGNCDDLVLNFKELNVENVLTFRNQCKELKKCKFKEKIVKKNTCLFSSERY